LSECGLPTNPAIQVTYDLVGTEGQMFPFLQANFSKFYLARIFTSQLFENTWAPAQNRPNVKKGLTIGF